MDNSGRYFIFKYHVDKKYGGRIVSFYRCMVFQPLYFEQVFGRMISLIVSLVITIIILNIIKLPFIAGFIVGSILWSILHFNLKKILKD